MTIPLLADDATLDDVLAWVGAVGDEFGRGDP
jgi:hypothetical protein